MPILPAKSFDAWAQASIVDDTVILLHGENEDLKRDCLARLYRTIDADPRDAFRTVRLEPSDIDADISRLADEIGAVSMFGGVRLVAARCQTRRAIETSELVLSLPRVSCLVVILTGEIAEPDTLRRLSDKNTDFVAVHCEEEHAGDLRAFVLNELEKLDLGADGGALDAFLTLVAEDRASIRGEIEKLACYLGSPGRISLDDVHSVVADGAGLITEAATQAMMAGRTDLLASALDRMNANGVDSSAALLAAAWQLQSLHKAKARRWSGADRGMARLLGEQDIRGMALLLHMAVERARMDSRTAAVTNQQALLSITRLIETRSRRAQRG